MLKDIDDLFLPYSFDISIFFELTDPDFIDHIKRVGVVFYNRNILDGSRDRALVNYADVAKRLN